MWITSNRAPNFLRWPSNSEISRFFARTAILAKGHGIRPIGDRLIPHEFGRKKRANSEEKRMDDDGRVCEGGAGARAGSRGCGADADTLGAGQREIPRDLERSEIEGKKK